MKTSLLMLLIMTSGMVGGLGVAEAEDFNFTVPVRLSNIQADIVEVRVYCSVAATDCSGQSGEGGGSIYSAGRGNPAAMIARGLARCLPRGGCDDVGR